MSLFPGVAVITGAANGIGRQCAISFAAEGCTRIALLDKDEEGMSETSRLCKEQAPSSSTSESESTSQQTSLESSALLSQSTMSSSAATMQSQSQLSSSSSTRTPPQPPFYNVSCRTFIIPCDVSQENEVEASMDCVIEEWGRIDYAVNCAGMFSRTGPSCRTFSGDFDLITAVNYRGTWLCARAEVTRMKTQEPLATHDGRPGNRGSIVNIGSMMSWPKSPANNASGAAIVSLTKNDALNHSQDNIRINCVCPGIISTSMITGTSDNDPMVARAPMKRKGTAQEVADAVLFLCSPKATFIQGASLVVDGGYTIN